jgi:hypothetical protein
MGIEFAFDYSRVNDSFIWDEYMNSIKDKNSTHEKADKGSDIMKHYTCIECNTDFTLTEKEEQWYLKKGYPIPKRCKTCRDNKKMRDVIYDKIKTVLNNMNNEMDLSSLITEIKEDLFQYLKTTGHPYEKGENFLRTKLFVYKNKKHVHK